MNRICIACLTGWAQRKVELNKMAKATLPTNYQDDVLKSSMNGKRRYSITDNSDGTKCLDDVTQYDKVGSNFGAADMNKTNAAVNAAADASKIMDNVDDIAANTQAGYMMGALAGKQLIQNLNGYKFDVIDGIPSYKAGADAAWVPFSNPEVYFAQYSFPGDQSTIPFTLSKAQLWLLTNGNWFTQYQNQLKLQINGATVPVASYTKYNNCYIAKYDTKQYINSAASLLVNRSMVVANAYTYIMLIGV